MKQDLKDKFREFKHNLIQAIDKIEQRNIDEKIRYDLEEFIATT